MLQHVLVLGLQNPAGTGLDGHAGQLGQLVAPVFNQRMPLGLQRQQGIAQHLPHVGPEFLKLGPGLFHPGLKTVVVRVVANKLGFFAQLAGFFVLLMGCGHFALRLLLKRPGLLRKLLYFGLGFAPGFFQHLLTFSVRSAKNFACAFLGPGTHPRKIIFLLLVLGALTEQRLLHGIELLRGCLALAHKDGAPFFAQLV